MNLMSKVVKSMHVRHKISFFLQIKLKQIAENGHVRIINLLLSPGRTSAVLRLPWWWCLADASLDSLKLLLPLSLRPPLGALLLIFMLFIVLIGRSNSLWPPSRWAFSLPIYDPSLVILTCSRSTSGGMVAQIGLRNSTSTNKRRVLGPLLGLRLLWSMVNRLLMWSSKNPIWCQCCSSWQPETSSFRC